MMKKKQTSMFPFILVAILLHVLVFWIMLRERESKEPSPDIIEVAFDSPTPLPEPEPEPLPEPEPPPPPLPEPLPEPPSPPAPEPPRKNMVLDEEPPKDKVISDENSDVGVKGGDDVQKPDVEGEKFKFPAFGKSVSVNTRKMWESYKLQKGNKWKGQNLQVRVFFRVSSDGSVSGVRVSKSSGNTGFDAFALEFFSNLKVDKFTDDMLKAVPPKYKQRIVIALTS